MGKPIKSQPVSVLISAQQIYQFASEEMHNFYGHVEQQHREGKVSTSYKDKLEANLRQRIERNNEIVSEIEKEIFGRMEHDFGGTTSKIMKVLVPKYEQEVEDFAKENVNKEDPKKKKEPAVKTLDTKVSRERKL